MKKCKYISDYIESIRSGKIPASKELHQACGYIEKKLSDPDVLIDTAKTEKAIELIERYFKISLFEWERFVLALIHCYYRSTDTVVFSEFLIMMGRGNGKNGFKMCIRDRDYIAARNAILDFANQFHRADECGRLEAK